MASWQAQLAEAGEPRRPPAWVRDLNQAVEQALAQPDPQPPDGVSFSDWERVVQARQADASLSAERLRRLGPQVQPSDVMASLGEVAVRRPKKRGSPNLDNGYVRGHGLSLPDQPRRRRQSVAQYSVASRDAALSLGRP